MSSIALASARARRTGETSQQSANRGRPVTSSNYNQPTNVRVAKTQQPMQRPPTQQQIQRTSVQQPQIQHSNLNQYSQNNKFEEPQSLIENSKLSIPAVVGLITLRLGKVEQWIIDNTAENKEKNNEFTIPENHKLIDNSIFSNMISRLDSLEKNNLNGGSSIANISALETEITQLKNELNTTNGILKKMGEDVTKHTIELAKNNEQIFKFNRDLVETKDILKTFMVKYDIFVQETADNFADYELALNDIETKIVPSLLENNLQNLEQENENDEILSNNQTLSSNINDIDFNIKDDGNTKIVDLSSEI